MSTNINILNILRVNCQAIFPLASESFFIWNNYLFIIKLKFRIYITMTIVLIDTLDS